ncbi:kynureninase [Deinococcus sp. KNUC1210]|uniref:kynureninase n=1 Tax=Deinococcus sp. KNUC1210 TaxID=2917691 RepID=UPI001EF0C14B|nr:kynureninase [Deinococcus sp. KNUC1210]ULH14626.1 kynureninase [Deinococcus sp. KNUC1210]
MTTMHRTVPAELLALDARDPLAHKRAEFALPSGLIYLDGNSLGALPAHVPARLAHVAQQEWGNQLIRSWTGGADEGRDWMQLPDRVAARIARLIGAQPHEVAVGDSTSVNLFKLLSAALPLRPDRRVILTDAENFPTDLYVAQGLNALQGGRYELRRVPTAGLEAALNDEVAVLLLTEVDYRSGARHDLRAMTEAAHAHGILTVWDLAHSAGAFPVELDAAGADFALGCGYKFLNGGPGAPSFLYVAERHLESVQVFLSGWMGHADPFEMARDYAPAPGARRFVVGTPSILNLSALDAALEVFEGVDLHQVRAKSLALARTFTEQMQPLTARFPLELVTPHDEDRRGSQVAYRHPQASEVMRRLIAAGVIGDFRTPDILRFGLTPLYLSHADVWEAVQTIGRVLEEGL